MTRSERWRAIGGEVARGYKADHLPLLAAGVAYFAVLALVPAVGALVGIYGLLTSPSEVEPQLDEWLTAVPDDVRTLILDQVQAQAARASTSLGLQAAIALLLSLWAAAAGMRWLMTALTLVHGGEERRSALRVRLTALALTAGALVGLAALVGLLTAATTLAQHYGLSPGGRTAITVVRWPVVVGLIVVGLGVLYRFGPGSERPRRRLITAGTLVATGIALAASVGLTVYTASSVGASAAYRALGAVVVLALWFWLLALSVLLGAEVDAAAERGARN